MKMCRVLVDGEILASEVNYCETSSEIRKGLLGEGYLPADAGAILEVPGWRAGARGFWTSIHMFGMKFSIAVAWLDKDGVVVHRALAKPWGYYASPKGAHRVLEVAPEHFEKLKIGSKVTWEDSPGAQGNKKGAS